MKILLISQVEQGLQRVLNTQINPLYKKLMILKIEKIPLMEF